MPVRYQVRGRIPDILLPPVTGAAPVPVRGRPREAVVLLFPDDRPGWDDYLGRVAGHADAFADWDGRAIAVAPGIDGRWGRLAGELGDSLWIVRDDDGRLDPASPRSSAVDTTAATAATAGATATGVSAPAAAVVDRYGEVYQVWETRPEPRELEEWLRFLALQCPE